MKLQDIYVGMLVQDTYGNQYRVLSVTPKDAQCVKLECTHFERSVNVGDKTYFDGIGQARWVLRDRDCIRQSLSITDETIADKADYQMCLVVGEGASLDVDITLETLEVACG